jgi:hypothetical protein
VASRARLSGSLLILFAKSVNAFDTLSFDRQFVECCPSSVAEFPRYSMTSLDSRPNARVACQLLSL